MSPAPAVERRDFAPAWRVGLAMALMYAAIGVTLPYLPVWFRDVRKLSAAEISAIFAGATLLRILTGPLLATGADLCADRRLPLAASMLAASALWAALFGAHAFLALFCVYFLAQTIFSIGPPLIEAAALRATRSPARTEAPPYGLVRAFASAAYMAANLVGGFCLKHFGPAAAVWLAAALSGAAALASLAMVREANPQARTEISFSRRLRGALSVLRRPGMKALLISTGILQGAHAFLYVFSSIIWKAKGYSPETIGALWATGVGVEIAFLASAAWIARRMSPDTLILAGGCVGIARWIGMGFSPALPVAFALQALHAGSFAMTHLGAMRYVSERLPVEDGPMAQTLMSGLGGGVVIGALTLLSGPLFERCGAGGYWAMAAAAAIGLAIAFWGLRRRLAP